ncbi:MAG TPA: ABC transporter ATP-binding protein [Chloroflexota bacterium]|nr:ABC transporter ATP-binding protein [Chloroflexota bacterium]
MQPSRELAIFLKPYWRSAVLAPLLMVLEVTMDLLQPRLIQTIIDQGIARSDLLVVEHTGLLMVLCATLGLGGGMGCAVFAVLAAQGFGANLRGALFRKVQSLSFGNLDRLETGRLITRLTSDVSQVQDVVMMLLRVMVRVPLLLVGSLIMAVLTSPRLASLFVVLIPLVLITIVWIIRRTFPMYRQVQARLDELNTVMQENLAGVRVVKAFARAVEEIRRFRGVNDQLMDQNVAVVRVGAVTMPTMMLIVNLGVVGALWFGGVEVDRGGLEVGQLIAFINYLMQTLMSLMSISMLTVRISRAAASSARIKEVLDSEPELRVRPNALLDFAPRGRVAFEGVSFRYQIDEPDPVLKNLDFVAEPGETVAVLGATGAGKSSLVNLIPRFYDATEGRVTIDGVDVRDVAEAALRGRIGIALQEAVLFSGTIRDNIRYGQPSASEAEVIEAARLAQAHDFISRFPDGYDTIVGQRGVNLSGGQKQRIAIARALLVDPTVLILDDSTSAVDVETEARIQAGLAERQHRQTRFVVAQRVSTVLSADKILVLDDGQIVAAGRHRDLVRESAIYREIYESQLEDRSVHHRGGD